MASPEFTQQGFVFINASGNYAQEGSAGGFARADKTVRWVENIAQATIFHTARPYGGVAQKHLDVLKKCQCLEAVATRTVKLHRWNPLDKEGE
jgi:hypothetical protein